MKKWTKTFFAAVLAGMLCTPALSSAADFSGVYIAPKLIGGIETGTAKLYEESVGALPEASQSFNSGVFGGGLALGYNFKNMGVPIRAEVEVAAFTNATKSKTYSNAWGSGVDLKLTGKSSITSLFANVYYDIETGTAFTPYIGAGIGVAWNRLSVTEVSGTAAGITVGLPNLSGHTSTQFAWNIGVGCAYAFSENISIDFGYRYAQFGNGKTKTANYYGLASVYAKSSRPTAMHQFMLGMRVSF